MRQVTRNLTRFFEAFPERFPEVGSDEFLILQNVKLRII